MHIIIQVYSSKSSVKHQLRLLQLIIMTYLITNNSEHIKDDSQTGPLIWSCSDNI